MALASESPGFRPEHPLTPPFYFLMKLLTYLWNSDNEVHLYYHHITSMLWLVLEWEFPTALRCFLRHLVNDKCTRMCLWTYVSAAEPPATVTQAFLLTAQGIWLAQLHPSAERLPEGRGLCPLAQSCWRAPESCTKGNASHLEEGIVFIIYDSTGARVV